MAVVRSPDFLRALIRETALATLIHQRRLTPSCGGQAPTAERTVGPARMIAESLTSKGTYRHAATMSALEAKPDDICSLRAFPVFDPQETSRNFFARAPGRVVGEIQST